MGLCSYSTKFIFIFMSKHKILAFLWAVSVSFSVDLFAQDYMWKDIPPESVPLYHCDSQLIETEILHFFSLQDSVLSLRVPWKLCIEKLDMRYGSYENCHLLTLRPYSSCSIPYFNDPLMGFIKLNDYLIFIGKGETKYFFSPILSEYTDVPFSVFPKNDSITQPYLSFVFCKNHIYIMESRIATP